MSVNSNPYFIGMMMLLLNLGGRFISMEMSQSQELFFQNPWVRRLLIFTIIFVGTRNIVVAFIMTFFIILFIGYLFNENSSLCIFKNGIPGSECKNEALQPQVQGQGPPQQPHQLTKDEFEIMRRLQEKHAQSQPAQKVQMQEQEPNVIDMYFHNMETLQQGN
jgi:hypothetical protein